MAGERARHHIARQPDPAVLDSFPDEIRCAARFAGNDQGANHAGDCTVDRLADGVIETARSGFHKENGGAQLRRHQHASRSQTRIAGDDIPVG